jgi:ATP-dependent helicase/nuclease subunit A
MTDAAARELARTVFDRPVVVEAGAGTGKTTALVARVLTWCLADGWEAARAELGDTDPADVAARVLDGVVAITFTEAAAAEMADRIGRGLAGLAAGEDVVGLPKERLGLRDEVLAVRCRAMLESIDRLVVSTIHAFCRRILATAPLDAGLHPDFGIDADGSVLAEVVYEVVEDQFTRAFGSDSPLRTKLLVLAGQGIGPEQLAEALTRLMGLALPSAALAEDPLGRERVAALLGRASDELGTLLDLITPPLFAVQLEVPITVALEEGLRRLRAVVGGTPPTPQGLARLAEDVERLLPDNLVARLRLWARGKLNAAESRLFTKVRQTLRPAAARVQRQVRHLGQLHPERLDAARQVLEPALKAVETAMNARGAMTFGALLRDARDLLADSESTRRRLQRRIRHVLVDEFQDTDPVQCDLVRLLALDGPVGARPGLFVVGDPKQSIYGWRSADLVAYSDFLESVEEAGGEVLALTVNRRSKRPILEEVDRIVGPIMAEDRGYQPRFEPLVAGRADADEPPVGPWSAVEHWISWRWDFGGDTPDPRPRAMTAAKIEARAFAADVARLQRHGVELSRIALLLRSTGDLDVYLTAMREQGLPYVVERDRSYFRRREIIDAAATIRCILEPADHLALLTMLRSSLIGVPDAALIPLWSRGLPKLATELYGATEESIGPLRALAASAAEHVAGLGVPGMDRIAGWEHTLVEALAHVAWLREAYETLPADEWVERLRSLLLVEAAEGARYLGSYRLANLDRFFRRLTSALERGAGSPQTVLRLLRTSVEQGREAEEARPGDAAERAVRVMTIHKSKGLDFDHVYVGQVHKTRRWGELTPSNLGEATRARRVGEVWEYELFGARTPGFDAVVQHEERVEQCERVRLLYVATTRAKERLVIMGRWMERPWPVPVAYARSMVELIASRAGGHPDLLAAMRRLKVSGELAIEEDGARWVFPGLRHDRDEERPRRVDPDASPDLAAIRADRAALHDSRIAAGARMGRRTSVAASESAHRALEDRLDAPKVAPDGGGNLGAAVGTAVHRALEHWNGRAPPEAELVRLTPSLRGWLTTDVPQERLEVAVRRATALLEIFARGALGARFSRLADCLVARELPLLAPPSSGPDAPVGYVAGAIDLVYLDPDSGELVVVDYKTDRVPDEAALQDRASAYLLQGRVYAEAVRDALGLGYRPRVELWFLSVDRVISA